MTAMDPVAIGRIPMVIMVSAESNNPRERNILALLLSETVAIKNLLMPYEMDIADKAPPRSPFD